MVALLALGTFDDRSLDLANFSMVALLTLRTFDDRLPMQIQSLLYIKRAICIYML